MNIFFDTSILVAASERNHPHYARALPVIQRVVAGKDQGFISTHSIAEIYATLTRMPVQPRIHPSEAERIITNNILPHFNLVPLDKKDYIAALARVTGGGWNGAKIYDALLLESASKCAANRIYTFNLVDFQRLAAPELVKKICAP